MIDPWAVAVVGFIAVGVAAGLMLAVALAFSFRPLRPFPNIPPSAVAPNRETD